METSASNPSALAGVEILAEVSTEFAEILTPEALRFAVKLQREFGDRRQALLQNRVERQAEINAGKMPDFLTDTRHIKEGNWQVAPIPDDLQDRRVEITGPADRKMIINALNSPRRFVRNSQINCWPTIVHLPLTGGGTRMKLDSGAFRKNWEPWAINFNLLPWPVSIR